MRYCKGKWLYRGREYDTLHEAMMSVVLPNRTVSNP